MLTRTGILACHLRTGSAHEFATQSVAQGRAFPGRAKDEKAADTAGNQVLNEPLKPGMIESLRIIQRRDHGGDDSSQRPGSFWRIHERMQVYRLMPKSGPRIDECGKETELNRFNGQSGPSTDLMLNRTWNCANTRLYFFHSVPIRTEKGLSLAARGHALGCGISELR